MTIVFDILHLAVAALLAVIGIGYERDEDCPPVRFEPSAQVQTIEPSQAEQSEAHLMLASDCESARKSVRFPTL